MGTIPNGVMANSPVPLSRRPGHGDLCQGDGPGEGTLLHGWEEGPAGTSGLNGAGSLIAGRGFTFNSDEHDGEHGVRSGPGEPLAPEHRDRTGASSYQQEPGKQRGDVSRTGVSPWRRT
jgi:hypothetical protein